MNRLYTSPISGAVGFFPKKGTWDFLQDANKDIFNQIALSLVRNKYGNYSGGGIYSLVGCKIVSVGGGNTNFGSGSILYQGEIYTFPSQSIPTPGGGDVFLLRVKETPYTTFADPNSFTDGTPRNVHMIRTAEVYTGSSGTGGIGNYSSIVFPFESPYLERSAIDGDYIDLVQNKTIFYTNMTSAGVSTLNIMFGNAIVGTEICIYTTVDTGSSTGINIVGSLGETINFFALNPLTSLLTASLVFLRLKYLGVTNLLSTPGGAAGSPILLMECRVS